MKQLLLMFVILTTSIINAQTFDFGCGLTPAELAELAALRTERLADINALDADVTDLIDIAYATSATKGDAFRVYIGTTSTEYLYTRDYGANSRLIENLTSDEYDDYKAAVIAEAINQDPNYVDPTNEETIQFELDKIFGSSTAPSDDIDDYPGIKNNTLQIGDVTAKQDRIAALNGDGYSIQYNNVFPHSFSDNQGNEFVIADYNAGSSSANTLSGIDRDNWSRLYLDIVTAKWEFLNSPPPSELTPAELAALRTVRINQLDGYVDGPSTVTHGTADSSDAFTVDSSDLPFGQHPQTFSTIHYGDDKVENLEISEFDNLVADILAKVDALNPLSDYSLGLELDRFYARESIPTFNFDNYGNKLSAEISADLATAADIAFDAGLAAQETFIKLLAHGATFKGGDSYVIWDSTINYYHIVTSNVGSGNGYFDIRLDDNNHYLNTNINPTLAKSNFRHLAWHVMSNLWHLAGTTDEELVVFRETEMTVYADANPNKLCTCDWRAGSYESNGITVYRAQWENFNWDYVPDFRAFPVDGYQSGAKKIDDLSAANWDQMLTEWKAEVDIST